MFKLLLILTSILTTSPHTHDANVGALVYDYYSGDTIDAYRSNSVIPPASTMKLLTTATALEVWGGNYTISTPITYDGYIKNGTLHGNLYIEGKGDPTFGSRYVGDPDFMRKWVKNLQEVGIKRITGSVIADASYISEDPINPGWLWQDAGNYYAPGIFGLSYIDNTLEIELKSDDIGSQATVLKTNPELPEVQFENHIRCTTVTYDNAYVHGMPYNNQRYLVGSIPSNRGRFTIKGDLPNPPLLLARDFVALLDSCGINVEHGADYIAEETTKTTPRMLLFTHESEPLSQIIRHTNQISDNLYAEMLFRILGSKDSISCNIENAEEFIRDYWQERGICLRSARILDGCGLSPQDAISPEMYVQLLRYMYESKNKDVFIASLPCSGESGTLKSFLRDTPLHGKVYAKSGTIGGTKNYAGYIFLPDGRVWIFAVMINSTNCRSRDTQQVIEQYLLNVYQANT